MAEAGQRDHGARILLILASVVVVVAGLKAAAGLILPFLVATFLALVNLPLLNWLRSMRIPRNIAVLVTIVVAVSVLVAIAVMLGGSIQEFTREAPKYRLRIAEMYGGFLDWLQARGVPFTERLTAEMINPADALDMMTGTLRRIAAVLSNLLLVFLTIVFILFEASGFPAKLQAAFGKPESSERFNKIRAEIQRYLGIKSLVSLATGILIGTSMWFIGIDFAMLWGALAFLLNYIPTLGSILAGVPPVAIAMIQLGPGYALIVALIFLTVNIVLGSLVEPYLMGRRLGLSTLVVFLSLVFWGWVWGPVGMLLSVPLTMILKIFLDNFEDLRWLSVLLDRAPPPRGAQTD